MANFHPSDNLLLEFSAGNLDWALSICVSAHIQFCPHCRNKVMQFNSIGGTVLDKVEPQSVSASSFDSIMDKIKQTANESVEDETTDITNRGDSDERTRALPKVVRKLIPDDKPLKWRYISSDLHSAQLETGQDKYEVSFHKIKRGGKVVEHDHRGLEVTLVLEGSFSDDKGNYVPGDFIEKAPGDIHRPMAAQDQDCLCLSVVEAPVKVTGFIGKLINPFLSISPR